ncbi:hypothetical protein BDP27DRAFT_1528150 [Rhodocollybia butyracea]|uniref:Integrase core domain-containing protein n=1 Tax=Rhodocollybia butyracea TaxID=206335 RepID=A0A9P5P552_9AGAR|nr:hypothetical protein BDP27DRAFT_1528150 [Rhodocollybia butyracea]
MNEVRGLERGSYIYGKSVHNIRIERLWVDVTRGFGKKWKDLFRALETAHGLNIDNDRHLWLLHHLFLERINNDIDVWIRSWNYHTLSSRTQTHQNSSCHVSTRGIFPEPEEEQRGDEAYANYGVDWDGIEDPQLLAHHRQHNPADLAGLSNEFDRDRPEEMSHVEVPAVQGLNEQGLASLDEFLHRLPYFSNMDQESLKQLWDSASNFARSLG